jgi:hypothetical protein
MIVIGMLGALGCGPVAAVAGRAGCRGVTLGAVWQLADGSRRLVLSPGTLQSQRAESCDHGCSRCAAGPFAVSTGLGTVYADRIAMRRRHLLVRSAGAGGTVARAEVRTHLRFLVG